MGLGALAHGSRFPGAGSAAVLIQPRPFAGPQPPAVASAGSLTRRRISERNTDRRAGREGQHAKALPPDVYNRGRLQGQNRRVAPVPQPRTEASRRALMRGDAQAGELVEAEPDAAPAFDINEIMSGLRAALESAESDEDRDLLNEQLSVLRPFALLSKKRALTEDEQAVVDEIGRSLRAQAERQAGSEVAADTEQRVLYERDQAQASDAREVLAELERDLVAKADIAARRAQEVDAFAAEARAYVPTILKEARKLEGDAKRAEADVRAIEKRLAEIPGEVATAKGRSDKAAVKALAAEEKVAEEDKQRAVDYIAGAADRLREIAAEEAAIAAKGPRLEAERDAAIKAATDAEGVLLLTAAPEAKVPRKRARAIPNREEAIRDKQIEVLEEAIAPLSQNIKRALFEQGQSNAAALALAQGIAQAQPGPPPQYISSWTADSIMLPASYGNSTVPILRSVIKTALGAVGTNRQGNPPTKKQLFAIIKQKGLEQQLADAVTAAGR